MPDAESLVLRLEGFEGPMDLLLDLARGQKVDLARISILSLVDQYLAIVEGAGRVRLELAADWLVMAAWLAWLKSRLLLPTAADPEAEGEQGAEALAARLRELQSARAAAVWLDARPQLRRDVFPRGAAECLTALDRSGLATEMSSLMRAYLAALRRAAGRASYRPRPMTLWNVQDALARLQSMLGQVPEWTTLDRFLPPDLRERLRCRAALASTFLAGLELARAGTLRLRQDEQFGPILVRLEPQVENGR